MLVGGTSMFGSASSTWGGGGTFRARTTHLGSPRYRELDRRQSYFDSTQHDWKRYDFDGRIIQAGAMGGAGMFSTTQPLMSGEVMPFYVPLRQRRPSAPYRLGKVIVNAFTNLLFGQQRFPTIRVEGDGAAQDWCSAFSRAAKLPMRMIRARNIGGSVGTAGLSWSFDARGKPRVEVHNGKHLFVHEWEDRESLVPSHVSEVYVHSRNEWDAQKKKFNDNWYWYRRDWTPDAEIVFKETPFKGTLDPVWEPDLLRSCIHGDDKCHLHWVQNFPCEDIDGKPDYDGLYESFDAIDLLLSVITRGATLNLDPTLVLNMDPEVLKFQRIMKGSDNSLAVGEGGDAKYLELAGTSLEAGLKLFEAKRRAILETADCIIPDPNEVAAQGISSVAIKAMFAPMLGKADIYREQYGTPVERLLADAMEAARKKEKVTIFVTDNSGSGPQPEEVDLLITLPPRVEKVPVQPPPPPPVDPAAPETEPGDLLDPNRAPVPPGGEKAPPPPPAAPPAAPGAPPPPPAPGKPPGPPGAPPVPGQPPAPPPAAPGVKDPATGAGLEQVVLVERGPGHAGEIDLSWPQYFPPTPQDQNQIVTTLGLATGGKALLSQQTGVELASAAFGHEPDEEWDRVQNMKVADDAQEIAKAQAFGAASDFMGGGGGSTAPDPDADPDAEPDDGGPASPKALDALLDDGTGGAPPGGIPKPKLRPPKGGPGTPAPPGGFPKRK